MRFGRWLRRYWPETLLFMAVALPWLSLFALGLLWLWQGGRVWVWAVAAAALGLLAWPLSVLVRRRANEEARLALGDLAAPSTGWYTIERDAWAEVLAIADATAPFSFAATEPLVAKARDIVEVVARRFHPETQMAWARFSLPEFLLLTERLSRDVRREALRHIPAVRAMRLSHLLWVHRQNERYGAVAQTGWRMGFGLWRVIRAALNPLQAAGQETSGLFLESTTRVLSYRLRAYGTRLLVLEIGRAAFRAACAFRPGLARRAGARHGGPARCRPARANRPGRPGQRRKVQPPECIGPGDQGRYRAPADDIERRRTLARPRWASMRDARRPAGARREHGDRVGVAGTGRTCRPRHVGGFRDAAGPRPRSQATR